MLARHALPRPHLGRKFCDDLTKPLRIEHVGCFREGPQRRSAAAQFSLDVLQLRGLLQRPQRPQARIEHEQQHQPAVLVHEELAVAGLVALATNRVQPLK